MITFGTYGTKFPNATDFAVHHFHVNFTGEFDKCEIGNKVMSPKPFGFLSFGNYTRVFEQPVQQWLQLNFMTTISQSQRLYS